MKILMLMKTMRYDGGVETSVASIANALAKKGLDVYVASFAIHEKDNLMSRLDLPDDHVFYLGKLGWGFPAQVFKLRKLMRLHKFDILHTHLFHPGLMGRVSAFGLNVATVATEHSTFFDWWKWYHYTTDRLLSRKTHVHIAVSRSVAATLAARTGIKPNKIYVIPNSVDTARFQFADTGSGSPAKHIVLIGRLEYAKNIEFAIEVVKELASCDDSIKLSVSGDGSRRETLEEICKKEKMIGKNIEFIGTTPDIHSLMIKSDLLLFSSHWEGCPMTIMEAYSTGLPVAATAVPGIIDIVHDGRTGILLEPNHAKEAAHKIHRLFNNNSFRQQLIGAARDESAKFHPEEIVEKVIVAYNHAIKVKNQVNL